MKNAAPAPAYAATLTGTNGQVVAKFRVKSLKSTNHKDEPVALTVLGESPEFAGNLVVLSGNCACLYNCAGQRVYGGYQRGTGFIYQKLPVRLHTVTGRALGYINTHSGQRQAQHSHFAGLWCANMEKANEVTRRMREMSGTRTTDERKAITAERHAEKVAKFAGKAERAEQALATVAERFTKRFDAAKRKLEKAGEPLVFNNGVRDIDAVLLQAFGMYAEPNERTLADVIAYEQGELAHKAAAYRKGQEPTPYRHA